MEMVMVLKMVWTEGEAVDALVLALGAGKMRVVPVDSADALELTLREGAWEDDCGRLVSFDFIGALSTAAAGLCSSLFPLISTVAS